MGRTATTFGIVLVLVLLATVVLIVFTGGDRSPQADAKPTQTAAVAAGGKTALTPANGGSRVVSSRKAPPASEVLRQGARKTPPLEIGTRAAGVPAALGVSAPASAPAVTSGTAPSSAAAAPPPAPRIEPAKTEPAPSASSGAPDAVVAPADPSPTAPLLDHAAFLQEIEKPKPPPATPNPPAPAPVAGGGVPGVTGASRTGGSDFGAAGAAPAAGTAVVDLAKPDYTIYVTRKDDTLWELAVQFLQDGAKWPEIVKANPGLAPDGRMLPEGYRLRIPPPAATRAAASPPPPANTVPYTIKAGDKLWNLALTLYGEGKLYMEILAANPGLDGAKLSVGKVIYLPIIPGKGPKGSGPETPPAKN